MWRKGKRKARGGRNLAATNVTGSTEPWKSESKVTVFRVETGKPVVTDTVESGDTTDLGGGIDANPCPTPQSPRFAPFGRGLGTPIIYQRSLRNPKTQVRAANLAFEMTIIFLETVIFLRIIFVEDGPPFPCLLCSRRRCHGHGGPGLQHGMPNVSTRHRRFPGQKALEDARFSFLPTAC